MNDYKINIYEQTAKNIKKHREAAGYTQAKLAEMVGLSHEFIRRIESKKGKKNFSYETVWAISRALKVPMDILAEIDPDKFIIKKNDSKL